MYSACNDNAIMVAPSSGVEPISLNEKTLHEMYIILRPLQYTYYMKMTLFVIHY